MNKKENEGKKNTTVTIIILVIIGLLVIAGWLAASNFDFVNYVVKLHGG